MADQIFYQRREQRKERTSKEMNFRQETWLIVSEGTETEPNYFEGVYNFLKNNYPDKLNVKFKIESLGKNTQSLVRSVEQFFDYTAKLSRKSKIRYGKTFVVFDKDSFESQQFDNAIYQSEAKEYIPLWSNECIELWFLLHFELLQSDIGREQYKKKLSKYIGEKYDKTRIDIFNVICSKGGNLRLAITNSQELYDSSCEVCSPSQRIPCTTMFRFFEELEKQTCIKLADT